MARRATALADAISNPSEVLIQAKDLASRLSDGPELSSLLGRLRAGTKSTSRGRITQIIRSSRLISALIARCLKVCTPNNPKRQSEQDSAQFISRNPNNRTVTSKNMVAIKRADQHCWTRDTSPVQGHDLDLIATPGDLCALKAVGKTFPLKIYRTVLLSHQKIGRLQNDRLVIHMQSGYIETKMAHLSIFTPRSFNQYQRLYSRNPRIQPRPTRATQRSTQLLLSWRAVGPEVAVREQKVKAELSTSEAPTVDPTLKEGSHKQRSTKPSTRII